VSAPFLRVTEIFHSIQGESTWAGMPCTFVRLTGCPLRCTWCDSAYAFYGGKELSVEEILEQVRGYPTKHVCFTGGEPLLQKDALDLVETCLADGYHVLIETSGSLDLSDYRELEPRERLCLSVDVKCPSSQMQDENKLDELALLSPHDQVKAVIGEEGAHTQDYQSTEKDNIVVQGVQGNKYAIGYFGFSYYYNNPDEVKALEIDAGDGCVEPSLDTAANDEYTPLSRPLFTYASKQSLAEEHIAEFARFFVEQSGNEALVADSVGYVPLTDEQVEEQMDTLEAAIEDAQG
jgi:organic radical activating enzyme